MFSSLALHIGQIFSVLEFSLLFTEFLSFISQVGFFTDVIGKYECNDDEDLLTIGRFTSLSPLEVK